MEFPERCLICFLVIIMIFMFGVLIYEELFIRLPLKIAKRDYLLTHPELTVLKEWQREGELPVLNVNLNNKEE